MKAPGTASVGSARVSMSVPMFSMPGLGIQMEQMDSTVSKSKGKLSTKTLTTTAEGLPIGSIDELLRTRATVSPSDTLLAYSADSNDAGSYIYYTAKDLDSFADEAAAEYSRLGLGLTVCGRDTLVMVFPCLIVA